MLHRPVLPAPTRLGHATRSAVTKASVLVALVFLAAMLASCGLSDGVRLPHEETLVDDGHEPTVGGALAVRVEAESVAELGGFEVVEDGSASAGLALVQPVSVAAAAVGEEVAFTPFAVESAGAYTLWARMFGVDVDSDALYLGLDGELRRVWTPEHGRFVWVEVVREWLVVGEHRVSVGFGEPGVRVDLFAVVRAANARESELEALVVGGGSSVGEEPDEEPADDGDEPVCEPGEDDPPTQVEPVPEPPVEPPVEPSVPVGGVWSLRGDPGFEVGSLGGSAAAWYGRVLWEIDESRSGSNGAWALEAAGSDCLYRYGRSVHTYVQSVLAVFRLTGDLRLLDHVDRIAERMALELRDGWRGTADGSDGVQDGYRNWVRRYAAGVHQGKDTNMRDDARTSALVAQVAYALHVNRDLESPGGRDYGGHADFWLTYLVDDFEAKWRERRDVPEGFPIMGRPHTHDYYSWMKWHHYMGLLTGDVGYAAEAERMADVLWGEVREVATPAGTAYVWARSIVSLNGSADYLMPATYASMVFADVVELHLEGFHRWGSVVEVERFARTVTELMRGVELGSGEALASDVGGEVARAGIATDSDGPWRRVSTHGFGGSNFPLISAWDASGVLLGLTESVDQRGRIKPAAGAFIHAWYHGW
jgi:hypothetical protein